MKTLISPFRLQTALLMVLAFSQSLMAQKKAAPIKYSFDKKTNEALARADEYLNEVRYNEALAEYEKAYESAMAKQKKHNAASAELLAKLGHAQYKAGKSKEALATLREALELTNKHTKKPDRNYVMVRVYLAEAMRFNGTHDERMRLVGEAMDAAIDHIGPNSIEMAMACNGMAELLLDGDMEETILNLLLFTFEVCDSLLAPTDRRMVIAISNIGAALMKFNHNEVAEQFVVLGLERAAEMPNPRNHLVAYNLMTAAILESYNGNHGNAVKLVNLAEEIMIESLGHLHPFTCMVQTNKGAVLGMIDEPEKGILSIKTALKTLENTLGSECHFMAEGLYGLAMLYAQTARGQEALSHIRKANEISSKLDPDQWVRLIVANQGMIQGLYNHGLFRESLELAEETLERGSKHFEFGERNYLALLFPVLDSHYELGNFEEVVRLSEPHLATLQDPSEELTEIQGKMNFVLGRSHNRLGNSESAIDCLEKSTVALQAVYGPEHEWSTRAIEALAEARAAANR